VSMRAVGLKVLKKKLGEYVRLAESGETVLVTDRDRVVAEIVPPARMRSPLMADALLGWITPPALTSSTPPPRNPLASFHELKRELEQDRSDR
jgi:antitoxin (DNA-binding transcriptional repressor) of toxin-antitoxin stability system